MLESLSYHWDFAKIYFLSSSDGGDGQSTNQGPAVVDESLSSDIGHSSPLSLLLIITLINEAITTSLIVQSSSLTQLEKVRDSATVWSIPLVVDTRGRQIGGRNWWRWETPRLNIQHPSEKQFLANNYISAGFYSLLLFGVPIKKPLDSVRHQAVQQDVFFLTIFCKSQEKPGDQIRQRRISAYFWEAFDLKVCKSKISRREEGVLKHWALCGEGVISSARLRTTSCHRRQLARQKVAEHLGQNKLPSFSLSATSPATGK